jgi:ubiquitin carboxyl-terminal hydrolase 9/24
MYDLSFQGWLVDLVNRFGQLEGFQVLLDRFRSGNLNVPVIAALVRPFGLCYEVLTPHTVRKYFMPIVVSFQFYYYCIDI